MKFNFANGHSLNIWESEYDKIVITEGRITCTRPGDKIAMIEVPKQWMEGIPSRSGFQQDETSSVGGAAKELTTPKSIQPESVIVLPPSA